MKTLLRSINDHGEHYFALMFVCPGCREFGHSGLHMLPVNSPHKNPSWDWNKKEGTPTLHPSILTRSGPDGIEICHSYLRDGFFEFLEDSTHSLAGQRVEMPLLPSWVLDA